MNGQYSLRDIVSDGPVRAPRWCQHLIKLATHAAIAYALWAFTRHPLLAAILAGPCLWAVITLHELLRPSDPAPHTAWQHLADWMTDLAIATVPVAGAFIVSGDWLGAALLLGGCVAAYLAGHKDARP